MLLSSRSLILVIGSPSGLWITNMLIVNIQIIFYIFFPTFSPCFTTSIRFTIKISIKLFRVAHFKLNVIKQFILCVYFVGLEGYWTKNYKVSLPPTCPLCRDFGLNWVCLFSNIKWQLHNVLLQLSFSISYYKGTQSNTPI